MNNKLFYILLFIVITSCTKKQENGDTDSPKFQQYYVQGKQLYTKHCSNCHQETGKGLGRVYPPLDSSDFLVNKSAVFCLMRHGINGEVTVNGVSFVQAMPGVSSLTDLEIAEISTYIYNSWRNNTGLIEVNQVSEALKNCDQPSSSKM